MATIVLVVGALLCVVLFFILGRKTGGTQKKKIFNLIFKVFACIVLVWLLWLGVMVFQVGPAMKAM